MSLHRTSVARKFKPHFVFGDSCSSFGQQWNSRISRN